METQAYLSKTLTTDDPSRSKSVLSQQNLVGCSSVSPLMADSLSGSSSISPVTVDSIDLDSFLKNLLEGETVANPRLSDAPSTDNVFSLTSPPTLSSAKSGPSQTLVLVPYDSKKHFDCQEEEEEEEEEDDDQEEEEEEEEGEEEDGEDEENPYRWRCSYYKFHYRRLTVSDHFYGLRQNELKTPRSGYSTRTPRWWKPLFRPKEASITEDEPTGVGAGLQNLGNTCFINAVLQCFTHTVPFVLGLRSLNHHQKPCDPDIESFCLLRAIHDHIELSLNSSGRVVSPSEIFDNLNCISSFFQRYQQEDAHEFMQCLLDKLQSCCSESKTKNDLSSPDDYLVKEVFGGRLVSRLYCCNCGHISNTYEPLNDLSLEIEDADSLPSALESFTKVEKIEDLEAKFRCGHCKEEVSVEKQLMLDQAPSVATFHLKRFKAEGTFVEKIDKHVVFPLELDLQPYTIVNERSNEELKYQLYAVVKHSGFGPTSGHYVCYIRSSPDTWHELNDSWVTSVEEEAVLSQEAYILLYARLGIPWFSTAIMPKPCAHTGISDSSLKPVLDNIERASNPQVENSSDCGAHESKDVADKTSTQLSCEKQFEVETDESCVAAEGISGVPGKDSVFRVSMSIGSRDDNPIGDASIRPGSSNCSDEFDKNISTVSRIGQNNRNQGVDEASNDSCFPSTPCRCHCTDKCQKDSTGSGTHSHLKEHKHGIHRRGVNRAAMDQGRIAAIRYAKRMPTARGAKLMALMAPQSLGKMKKRARSRPCKRVSPHSRHNHNLMRQVPVSR